MAYINTKTNQYPVSEQDIRNEYPNTSFAVPFQTPEGYAPVLESPLLQYDAMTQSVREIAPSQDELGNWMRTYEVYDLTEEEIAVNEQAAKISNKQQAERMLAETDWVEVPSVSDITKIPHLANFQEFMTYRLTLRGIAVTPPVSINEWPVRPEETWTTE